jgi:hypothetical protein
MSKQLQSKFYGDWTFEEVTLLKTCVDMDMDMKLVFRLLPLWSEAEIEDMLASDLYEEYLQDIRQTALQEVGVKAK